MTRYFPEVVDAVKANFPERAVIDGEIVVLDRERNCLEFEVLQQRIHPAASRVNLLAVETPGELRRVRPAGARRRGPHRAAVPRAPGPAGGGAGQGGAAGAPHADHRRPRRRRGVVRPVRGRRAGRADRQGPRGHLPARQARDDQGEARAHRRLRGRGLPGAQVRAGRDRVAAAGALPGRRQAGLGRRDRRVPDGDATGARAGDAAAGHHVRRPPVGVGPPGGGRPHPAQGRGQPLEREQGPLVRPAAARAGRRGALRLHGGRALPAHRPVRAVAPRPRAVVLHVRAAGAAGHVRPGRGAGAA